MNNIYIGARYVPLFYTAPDGTNAWTAGVQYEALTIVTYLNQSYTSKIPVPASVGNPADNPEYWILTGGYNAQVELYRQDVLNYQQQVEDYSDLVENLVATLRHKERHVVVISDSFGTINGGGTVLSQDLGSALTNYLNWPAGYVHFKGRNSAGFYNDYFINSLTELISEMSADEKNSVTDLYVVGGWNDHNATEEVVRSKAAAFRASALSAFPNARLHTVFLAYGYISAISVINTLITTMGIYNTLTGFIAHPDAWPTLHDPSLMLANSDHPNNAGMLAIANTLGHIITFNEQTITRQHTLTSGLTLPEGYSFDTEAAYVFRETMHGNMSTINFYAIRMGVTLETAQTLALHNSSFKIGDISGLYNRGQLNNYNTAVTMQFYDNDWNLTLVPGAVTLNDKSLMFIPDTQKSTSGGNKSITIKHFTIPQFNLTMYSR